MSKQFILLYYKQGSPLVYNALAHSGDLAAAEETAKSEARCGAFSAVVVCEAHPVASFKVKTSVIRSGHLKGRKVYTVSQRRKP